MIDVPMYVHATTDSQEQAAAIAQRLLDEGTNATYWEVRDLLSEGFPIRSSFRYAVMVIGRQDCSADHL